MASNYPGSLDTFDTIATDKKTSDAVGGRTHRDMHNDLGDAVESIQGELGTNPSGSDATVAARLTAIEAGTNLGSGSVVEAKIADSAVTSAKIADGTIVNADINASAAIARSKISGLPTSSTDNTIVRFDSTAGAMQTSGVVIDDNNRLTVATGATGGYGFASGAVHLSGTGSPVGVVSAAPGSTWLQVGDAATASGNLLWRKISGTGNVGWMPEGALADTGWRNVTAAMDSTFKTNRPNGALYLRRQGSLCEVRFIESGTPTATSGLIYDMPDGFWGNGSAKATTVMLNADTVVGTTASMLVTYTNGEWLYCAGWGTVPYAGSLTWTTTRDWPASLPGSAA